MKLFKNPIFWIVVLVGGIIVIGYTVMMKTAEQQAEIRYKEEEQVFTLHAYDLFGIAVVRPTTLLAVGSYGMLLRSLDGGDTWEERQIGSPEQVFSSICFPDDKNGWIVGTRSMIFHTEDAGENWKQTQREGNILFKDVFFIDADHGWIVGEECTILRTDNGGKTWDFIDTDQFLLTFHAVRFVDQNRGWLVGEQGTVMFSSDGGRSWKKQDVVKKTEIFEELRAAKGREDSMYGGLEGVDDSEYTAISKVEVPPTFMSLAIPEENTVIVAGLGGTLYSSKDGGKSWEKNPVRVGTGHIENHIYKICTQVPMDARKDYNNFYLVGRGANYHSFDNLFSFRLMGVEDQYKQLITLGWTHDITFHPEQRTTFWTVGKWGVIFKSHGQNVLRVY